MQCIQMTPPRHDAHDVFLSRVDAPPTEESLHIHRRSAKLSLRGGSQTYIMGNYDALGASRCCRIGPLVTFILYNNQTATLFSCVSKVTRIVHQIILSDSLCVPERACLSASTTRRDRHCFRGQLRRSMERPSMQSASSLVFQCCGWEKPMILNDLV